jgi:outer membrane lipoprotein-sorting protein
MRRAFLIALTGLLAFAASPVRAQQASLDGAERSQVLAAASAALNAQRSLQGRFSQVAPDGQTTTGRFYLQRPGRVRFEYDPPAQFLIVADGSIVAIQDGALRTTNRAPLRSTPLFFVLKDGVNLERDARITRVVRDGDALLVSARDRSGQADGELTLRLEGPNYTLRSWDVVDATGGRTRVSLSGVQTAAALDPRLFRAPAATAVSPRGPGR